MNSAQGAGGRPGMPKETIASRLEAWMREKSHSAHSLGTALGNKPHRLTIQRCLDEGHTPYRSTLERLEIYFERPGKLVELLPRPEAKRDARRDRDLSGRWYGLIESQDHRKYETIDVVDLARTRVQGRLRGEIRRIHSTRKSSDVGEHWDTFGIVREESQLFLCFYSTSKVRFDSNGTIALRRGQSLDELTGYYLRFPNERQRAEQAPAFTIQWFRDPDAAQAASQKWTGEGID